MDYKEWIQNKEEEIASDKYDTDFYSLSQKLQIEVYSQAEEAYKDYCASQIDAAYEKQKYGG